MDIGFVGLGHMGGPMARNLLAAGHRVTVFNRSRGKAEALAAEGAQVADGPGGAARGEAVITMLSDDEAVEAVVFGEGNILATLRKGGVHIAMSTVGAALAERLTKAHAGHGQIHVAAPVLGRPDKAEAAQLAILAAGPEAALERCQPLFAAMGQRTFVMGSDPVAANVAKLGANFLIAAAIESLGEAVALVRKAGIDPKRYMEMLTTTLFAAPVYQGYGGMIVEERYSPAGFAMPLGLKDIRLALAAAEARRVPMPVASVVRDHLVSGLARGQEALDWSSLARVIAADAGL